MSDFVFGETLPTIHRDSLSKVWMSQSVTFLQFLLEVGVNRYYKHCNAKLQKGGSR